MALIDMKQVKHGQQFLTDVDNAVEKTAVITAPSEVPSDDLIPSETYFNAKLDEMVDSQPTSVETRLEVIGNDPVTTITLSDIPNDEPVKLIINGVEYHENADFAVDRQAGEVTWTGGFPLTGDTVDSIKAVYTAQPSRSGFPKAKHIIGMVLADEGSHDGDNIYVDGEGDTIGYLSAAGDWRRIDKNYNEVKFDPEHGTWAGMQEVTTSIGGVMGQFVEIPTTWVKNEVIPRGPYAGKNCWWIADGEAPGFHVHPAFIKPDGTPGKLRVGKYMATKPYDEDDEHSYANIMIDNNRYCFDVTTYRDMRGRALTYNTASENGYRAYSVYDHFFLIRMILIETGDPDQWQVYEYHGIKDVVGDNYANCLLDGLTTFDGTYQLLAADGSGTMVETGVSCPDGGTWIVNCLMNKVNGVDFGDIFINDGRNLDHDGFSWLQNYYDKDNPMLNGSFCDYQYILKNCALHVQYEAQYSYAGMFALNSIPVDDYETNNFLLCWRLVQVV